jgi:uncharacterized membrane protein (DUF106 family)
MKIKGLISFANSYIPKWLTLKLIIFSIIAALFSFPSSIIQKYLINYLIIMDWEKEVYFLLFFIGIIVLQVISGIYSNYVSMVYVERVTMSIKKNVI